MTGSARMHARWRHLWHGAALFIAAWAFGACAADFDYHLTPQQIAADTYVLVGKTEDFSVANGGNIVNCSFIVGPDGVLVIDSGPSRRYGEQLRAAIARITTLPVTRVVNTHHHPDHFLGNQAFPPETLSALAGTQSGIQAEGGAFNDNMYRMNGDWMSATEVTPPSHTLTPGIEHWGRHTIEFIALNGHTGSDLAVFDRSTGVLIAGDLAFHERAPTTPHANLAAWQAALTRLEGLDFKLIVPGHGPVARDATPIRQTRAWLVWLDSTLQVAAEDGLDMNEVMALPRPAEFAVLAVADAEYRRSVALLYPAYEQAALAPKNKK